MFNWQLALVITGNNIDQNTSRHMALLDHSHNRAQLEKATIEIGIFTCLRYKQVFL